MQLTNHIQWHPNVDFSDVKIVRKSFKKHDRQWFSILLLSGTVFSNILAPKTTPKIDRKSRKILFWLPNISSWRYKTFQEACKRPLRAPQEVSKTLSKCPGGPKTPCKRPPRRWLLLTVVHKFQRCWLYSHCLYGNASDLAGPSADFTVDSRLDAHQLHDAKFTMTSY